MSRDYWDGYSRGRSSGWSNSNNVERGSLSDKFENLREDSVALRNFNIIGVCFILAAMLFLNSEPGIQKVLVGVIVLNMVLGNFYALRK